MSSESSRKRLALGGLTIGISISDSEDLGRLGLDPIVVDLAYTEISRHLLAHGANLAYGGDHRDGGFASILFELIQTYDQPGQNVSDRTRNYLAWPLHLTLDDDRRVALNGVARLVEIPLEPDLKETFKLDPKVFLETKVPEEVETPEAMSESERRYVWTRSLTRMRERMRDEIDARIVVGGQTGKFLGRYPGIAEEALLGLGSPLYLLGGFGGCTRDLIDALGGGRPERLTRDFQCERSTHHKDYAPLDEEYNRRHPDAPIDYDALREQFAQAGISGLRNGLDEKENRILFETDDVDWMIALVLKGLSRVG